MPVVNDMASKIGRGLTPVNDDDDIIETSQAAANLAAKKEAVKELIEDQDVPVLQKPKRKEKKVQFNICTLDQSVADIVDKAARLEGSRKTLFLKALKAYGVPIPDHAFIDKRTLR